MSALCNECYEELTQAELLVYDLQWQHSGDMYCLKHRVCDDDCRKTPCRLKTLTDLFDRVRDGEIVPVRTPAGKRFSVQGEWFYGICWYSVILPNGRRDSQHNRLLLSTDTARDWFSQLELDIAPEDEIINLSAPSVAQQE